MAFDPNPTRSHLQYLGLSRTPQAAIYINGYRLPYPPVSVEVENNNFYAADHYHIVLALSTLPPEYDWRFWGNTKDAMVEVYAGLADSPGLPSQFHSLILGRVDELDIDPVSGELVLTGRDRTADLIEAKTSEKFPNKTASQIAQLLASRHGLTAQVVPTKTPVGQYYQIEHATLTSEDTEWNLLTHLAELEHYNVWIEGTVLHFEPPPSESNPYVIEYTPADQGFRALGSFIDLKCSRSLFLAKDIIVKVMSWHGKKKTGYTVTASAKSKNRSEELGGQGQTYTFSIPGLTKDQALQWAQNKAQELTQHERLITFQVPGDFNLTPRTVVILRGTGTDWDQTYFIDSIERRFSFDEGYIMSVRAKNHSPISTTAI